MPALPSQLAMRSARHSCWTVAELAAPESAKRGGGIFANPLFLSEHANRYVSRRVNKPLAWTAVDPPLNTILERLPAMLGPGMNKPAPPPDADADADAPARPATAPAKANTTPKEGTRLIVNSLLFGRLHFYLPALPRRAPSRSVTAVGQERPPADEPMSLEEAGDSLSVADFKRIIYERTLCSPAFRIELTLHGLILEDQVTLYELSLARQAELDMRLTRVPPELLHSRGLGRVRVHSPLLRTRAFPVDATTTVAELKQAICAALKQGEHTWFTSDGVCVRRAGATMMVAAKTKADAKAGTSALNAGEELLIEKIGDLKGGKGAVLAYRVANGAPVTIVEANVVELNETCMSAEATEGPTQMWINWGGRTLGDDFRLYDVGVRTDDKVTLEFLSPCLPKPLLTLRMPAPAKKGKGGKGGKKKK